MQGNPVYVIKNGEIQKDELKRLRYSYDDLVNCLRQAGTFDISQIENAIVETNGAISVETKPEYTPLTPNSLRMTKEEDN